MRWHDHYTVGKQESARALDDALNTAGVFIC
jgi:hypothetical protein